MARGNQRDLAREKNLKKQLELQKKKAANDKNSNKGMSLEQRKQRDAETMREKQRKALEKQQGHAISTLERHSSPFNIPIMVKEQ